MSLFSFLNSLITVPLKYFFLGDKEYGRGLVHLGASVLAELKNAMSYRGLKTGRVRRVFSRVIEIPDEVKVEQKGDA